MGKSDIDWMDWAIRVRERADRDGTDVHDAFGAVRIPDPAWRRIMDAGKAASPMLIVSEYDTHRARVTKLAASLVRMEIVRGARRVAV